jgi:serine O-acetyltransferase
MVSIYGWRDFMKLVEADADALGSGRKSFAFYVAATLGLNKFSVILLFRIAARLDGKGRIATAFARVATRLNSIWNSCDIDPRAKIGPGLRIPHPIGIVVGSITAGSNLTIFQNATLGVRNRNLSPSDHDTYANLGNDVQIGPGAAVLGGILIGHGATIGPNAFVFQDVPDGSVAVGYAARIIHRTAPGADAKRLEC